MKNKIVKLYRWSNTWVGTIVIVLLFMFFIAQAFLIPSPSMVHTMLVNDALFAKKFAYGVPIPRIPWIEVPILPDFNGNGHLIEGDKPKHGDIVIFRPPTNERIHFVKRCVAKEEDILMIRDRHLYIKIKGSDQETEKFAKEENYPIVTYEDTGKWLKNPYMSKHKGIWHDYEVEHFADKYVNFGPIKLKKDEYFMMGDNREHSNDSRFWGPINYRHIVGKPWFIYMSWDENYKIRWNRVGKSIEELEEELLKGIKTY